MLNNDSALLHWDATALEISEEIIAKGTFNSCVSGNERDCVIKVSC